MSSTSLPIIDLAGGTLDNPADVARIATEIGHAARDIGFFYLVNHGIPADLMTRVFARSADFFAEKPETKQALAIAKVGNNRGYVGLKTEALDPGKGEDSKEAFNIGYASDIDPANPPSDTSIPANAWPETPGFRTDVGAYFAQCLSLGRRLHRAIATDLGLAPDHFEPFFTRPMATLRLLHYPEREGAGEALGAGEHTDYGNLTLLATDAVGGLEVRRRDGTWIAAPSMAGAFVVNIGDCLMRWTNDIYVSTPHRVVAPKGRERYSVAFFLDPNADAPVAALPGTVPPGESPRYAPITAGEHLAERLRATYGKM